jgi:hypothetical protein
LEEVVGIGSPCTLHNLLPCSRLSSFGNVESSYRYSWKNGFMVWEECRASRKESRRHSPLESVKDRPWMTSVLSMLSYYHISNDGMDEAITF